VKDYQRYLRSDSRSKSTRRKAWIKARYKRQILDRAALNVEIAAVAIKGTLLLSTGSPFRQIALERKEHLRVDESQRQIDAGQGGEFQLAGVTQSRIMGTITCALSREPLRNAS
jgi:hypothetical protein